MGISRAPSKSSISYMNEHRDFNLFKDLYFALLSSLWNKDVNHRKELRSLKRKVYLMDASVIPLCLSMFDWATFRSNKGAAKLHTVLDYDGCLPVFMEITDSKVHESKKANSFSFPKGSVVVVDRGYVDFQWMNVLTARGVILLRVAEKQTGYNYSKEHLLIPAFRTKINWGKSVLKSKDTILIAVTVLDTVFYPINDSEVDLKKNVILKAVRNKNSKWEYGIVTFIPTSDSKDYSGIIISKSLLDNKNLIRYFTDGNIVNNNTVIQKNFANTTIRNKADANSKK